MKRIVLAVCIQRFMFSGVAFAGEVAGTGQSGISSICRLRRFIAELQGIYRK